jgi:hypothetical protein
MTDDNDTLVARAAQAGIDNFLATHGILPDRFKVLQQHAPGAFASSLDRGRGRLIACAVNKRDRPSAQRARRLEHLFCILHYPRQTRSNSGP